MVTAPRPSTGQLPQPLVADIVQSGYFPEIVAATVARAVGPEEVRGYLVHHEATFDRDELHRHVTVLVLTPTRLVVGHTDDGDHGPVAQALSTVETVALRTIRSVSVTNIVANPARYRAGQRMDEVWLTVGWGTMRRVEITPASCQDPNCEADHGYDAQDMTDDLTVRMSAAADGADNVERLLDFATALQLATA